MSLFQKLKQGLAKTSANIRSKIQSIFQPGALTDEFLDELEAVLIQADVGVEATTALIDSLRESRGKSFERVEDLIAPWLKKWLRSFATVDAPLQVADQGPTVYAMVGVNSSGKTTTIAKLAHRYTSKTRSNTCCGRHIQELRRDRADVWARRTGADLVRHSHGSDPGAVTLTPQGRQSLGRPTSCWWTLRAELHTKKNSWKNQRR